MREIKLRMVERIIEVLQRDMPSIALKKPGEIYAAGFLIEVQELPELVVSANLEETCRRACFRASSPEEARWNYAFWAQEPMIDVLADDTGIHLIEQWMAPFGTEPDEDTVFRCFGALAVDAAISLHARGEIQNIFGRSIPIIFHDLEGRDEMFEWTRIANPPGLADAFLNCNGGFA